MSVSGEYCATNDRAYAINPSQGNAAKVENAGKYCVRMIGFRHVFVEIIGAAPHKFYNDVKIRGCL
jgi:hypothetical protein